jgi:hypothetical protein
MRACHVDLQQRSHFIRQGQKQTLGASDASVFGEIVMEQDDAAKQRLTDLGLGQRSDRRSTTDAALALDRGPGNTRLVLACMHMHACM